MSDRPTVKRFLGQALRQTGERAGRLIHERGDFIETESWQEVSSNPDYVRYQPSGWSILPRALRGEDVGPGDVFLDYGCGKGRVLCQAARRRFDRVVGVELSDELAAIARRNLERNRSQFECQSFEIVTADVVDFEPPTDVTYAYFANPFSGTAFTTAIDGLLRSYDARPRDLRIIYVNPMQEAALLATGRVRHVRTSRELRQAIVARVAPRRVPYEDPTKISIYSVEPA
jgi:precorrin-6B methylase 2